MNTPKSSANTQNSSKSLKSLKNMTLGATLAAALVMGAPGCKQGAKNDKNSDPAKVENIDTSSKKKGQTTSNQSENISSTIAEGDEGWFLDMTDEDMKEFLDSLSPEERQAYLEMKQSAKEADSLEYLAFVESEKDLKKVDDQLNKADDKLKKIDAELRKSTRELEAQIASITEEEFLSNPKLYGSIDSYLQGCKEFGWTPIPKAYQLKAALEKAKRS
ncbi:MAG: hypothetical protein ACFNWZ_04035 [Candidatus Absconditicoccaceae bacterium]